MLSQYFASSLVPHSYIIAFFSIRDMRHGPLLVQASARMMGVQRNTAAGTHPESSISTSALRSSIGEAAADSPESRSMVDTQQEEPIPVPTAPNLYYLPRSLSAEYKPLPTLAQIAVWLTSTLLATLSVVRKLQVVAWIRAWQSKTIAWKKIGMVLLKSLVLGLTFTAILQDAFLSPSRISTSELAKRYFLPSSLSNYHTVNSPSNKVDSSTKASESEMGVHYLSYSSNGKSLHPGNTNSSSGIIYLNHGFGASSLSWLPAIQPLVDQLGYRQALAHDAPGFGFTERPSVEQGCFQPYTSQGSAHVGMQILSRHQQTTNNEPLVCMGHSMGAMTTLRMVIAVAKQQQQQSSASCPMQVILVDPALGIRRPSSKKHQQISTKQSSDLRPNSRFSPSAFLYKRLVTPLASYTLKRAVGHPGFWKAGLQVAWGSKFPVTSADVLRFQWPGIARGWEAGLVHFTRAQLSQGDGLSDQELLETVLAIPNVQVHVILGAEDSVVPPAAIRKFFQPYLDRVEIVELEGLGHDPFEEDVDTFVSAVKNLINSNNVVQ